MKATNAISRVEKNGAENKRKGTAAYRIIMNALNHGQAIIRTCYTSGKGRFCTNLDHTALVCLILDECKIKYIAGNDAPRGGLTGNYVKLTHINF